MASYIDLHNLGSYASIDALWAAHPEGGQEGDYCTIDGVKYRWDKYDRMWVANPNFGPTPARKVDTHYGDVNIHNDLTVAGYIRAKGIKQPCVGLFASVEALEAAYPDPEVGMWAVVGDTMPAPIYSCSTAGVWAATGEEGGVDEIDLTDYAHAEDVESLEEAIEDHEGRLEVLEDITSADVAYNRTVVAGSYIVREPSSDRGNIGSNTNTSLHIYTGLTAGSEIEVKFTGTNSTSVAQAAGWYTTNDVSQMSKDNFSAVSGLNNYLKNVMNQTFTVTVPEGAPTLVLSAAVDADTQVTAQAVVGGKITELEETVEDHEERISDLEETVEDHESALYVEQSVTKSVDETLDGYRIVNTVNSETYVSHPTDLDDVFPQFFILKSYKVTAGEKVRIVNSSSSQGRSTRVYGFYSNESLTDGQGNVLPSSATYIDVDDQHRPTWGNAVFNHEIIVPAGAKILLVTNNKRMPSNPEVYGFSKTSIVDAIEDFVDLIAGFTPYKMQASRSDKDVYVAYNAGNGVELLYWFGYVFTNSNNLLGLRAVGYRNVTRTNPVASWDVNEVTVLCNQTSSDMIAGAIHINGVMVGGSHRYPDNESGSTPTAVNTLWSIDVDGNPLGDGDTVNCSRVKVTAVNKFSVDAEGWGDVLDETIVMDVYGNSLDVEVSHDYKDYNGAVGKYIDRYYGMQSNGFGDRYTNLVSTVAGQYPNGVLHKDFVWNSFTKSSYPNFCEFISRKTDGWKQMMQLDTTSYNETDGFTYIGDHKWLGDTCPIGVATGGDTPVNKLYHVLVYQYEKKKITAGMKYFWKGTYRWWK